MPPDTPSRASRGEIEELRRIAFGRDSTEEERATATRQLTRLAAAESAAAAPGTSPAPAEGPYGETSTGDAEAAEVETTADEQAVAEQAAPTRRRTIAMVWLLPAVIASLVVGAVAGRTTAPSQQYPASTPAASHPPITDSAAGSDPVQNNGTDVVGSLAAAESWLARPPTAADTFPNPELIQSQSLSFVRLIKNVRGDDMLITVWGAKDPSGGICLLAGLHGGFFTSACASQENFIEHGIALGSNGFEVSWDGISTSVTFPMAILYD